MLRSTSRTKPSSQLAFAPVTGSVCGEDRGSAGSAHTRDRDKPSAVLAWYVFWLNNATHWHASLFIFKGLGCDAAGELLTHHAVQTGRILKWGREIKHNCTDELGFGFLCVFDESWASRGQNSSKDRSPGSGQKPSVIPSHGQPLQPGIFEMVGHRCSLSEVKTVPKVQVQVQERIVEAQKLVDTCKRVTQ